MTFTITTLQAVEVLGIAFGMTSSLVGGIYWFLNYYKNLIEHNLRQEFRHEIDRIVTEQNHLFCYLENNMPGYERLPFSGDYRDVFYQSCNQLK